VRRMQQDMERTLMVLVTKKYKLISHYIYSLKYTNRNIPKASYTRLTGVLPHLTSKSV